MNHQLFTKSRIGQSDLCPYQTCSITAEHLLLACLLHENLRHQFWLVDTQATSEAFWESGLDDIQCVTTFVQRM